MALPEQNDTDGSKYPLISIITPVYNCASLLEAHLRMVQLQTYPYVEHILIDGGSTDQTVEILHANTDRIGFWISEPDRGIYDAMNKGINAANGQWVFFAGVDDCFAAPDTIEKVFQNHQIEADTRMICGRVLRSDGKLINSRFGKWLYYKNTLPHQGVFYRSDIFATYRYGGSEMGGRDHYYQISGDYHLNLFLFRNGFKHQSVDMTIMHCGRGKSMKGSFTGYLEEMMIRQFFIGRLKSVFFDFLTILRYFRQRVLAG